MHKYKILKFLMILLLSFFIACSSDDDSSPTEPDEETPPTVEIKPIVVPQGIQTAANNGDPGASTAAAFINMANSLTAYSYLLTPPSGAGKISSYSAANNEWTWTDGGVTFTLSLQETATSFTYTLTVNGSFEGNTYNNQVMMTVTASKTSNSGELYFYEPGVSIPFLYAEWDTSPTGTYTFLMEINETDGQIKIDLLLNPDDSGSLSVNGADGSSWNISWTSQGTSGTWTYYDASGSLIDQGNWP